MPAALRPPLPATGFPAGIGCERWLVVLLRFSDDDGKEKLLLPHGRLTGAIKPSVGRLPWTTQSGNDHGGGIRGERISEGHGQILPQKKKYAMRKINLAKCPQCRQSDAVNQPHQPMKTEIRNFLKMLTDKAAENVAAGMSKKDAVNAVLNRLESEHPSLVAKLKEVLV